MEIKIEVSDEQFENVLKEELKAFNKEELHDICLRGLMNCIADPEKLKTFFKKDDSYSYYDDGTIDVRKLIRESANKIDFTSLFEEFKINITNYVKEHYDTLIKDMLIEVFMNGLSTYIYNNQTFKSQLQNELYALSNGIQQDLDNNYVRKH